MNKILKALSISLPIAVATTSITAVELASKNKDNILKNTMQSTEGVKSKTLTDVTVTPKTESYKNAGDGEIIIDWANVDLTGTELQYEYYDPIKKGHQVWKTIPQTGPTDSLKTIRNVTYNFQWKLLENSIYTVRDLPDFNLWRVEAGMTLVEGFKKEWAEAVYIGTNRAATSQIANDGEIQIDWDESKHLFVYGMDYRVVSLDGKYAGEVYEHYLGKVDNLPSGKYEIQLFAPSSYTKFIGGTPEPIPFEIAYLEFNNRIDGSHTYENKVINIKSPSFKGAKDGKFSIAHYEKIDNASLNIYKDGKFFKEVDWSIQYDLPEGEYSFIWEVDDGYEWDRQPYKMPNITLTDEPITQIEVDTLEDLSIEYVSPTYKGATNGKIIIKNFPDQLYKLTLKYKEINETIWKTVNSEVIPNISSGEYEFIINLDNKYVWDEVPQKIQNIFIPESNIGAITEDEINKNYAIIKSSDPSYIGAADGFIIIGDGFKQMPSDLDLLFKNVNDDEWSLVTSSKVDNLTIGEYIFKWIPKNGKVWSKNGIEPIEIHLHSNVVKLDGTIAESISLTKENSSFDGSKDGKIVIENSNVLSSNLFDLNYKSIDSDTWIKVSSNQSEISNLPVGEYSFKFTWDESKYTWNKPLPKINNLLIENKNLKRVSTNLLKHIHISKINDPEYINSATGKVDLFVLPHLPFGIEYKYKEIGSGEYKVITEKDLVNGYLLLPEGTYQFDISLKDGFIWQDTNEYNLYKDNFSKVIKMQDKNLFGVTSHGIWDMFEIKENSTRKNFISIKNYKKLKTGLVFEYRKISQNKSNWISATNGDIYTDSKGTYEFRIRISNDSPLVWIDSEPEIMTIATI